MTLTFIPQFFKWGTRCIVAAIEIGHTQKRQAEGIEALVQGQERLEATIEANAKEAREEHASIRRDTAKEFRSIRSEIVSWAQVMVARGPSGGGED